MIKLGVVFGGRSVEHEVSVISGIQAIMNLNRDKYDVTPIYMTKNNEMYVGDLIGDIESYKDINALLSKSQRVVMINDGSKVKLIEYPARKFGKGHDIDIDVAFPVVHGTNVEDGTLQGFLKTLGVPFVGCDVISSAVGMDKYIQKAILREQGIPVLDSSVFRMSDYADIDTMISKIENDYGYPVIVKPVNLGSSVGISVAKDKVSLTNAIDDAFRYSPKVIVEHAIEQLREINCSVLGDENDASASECEEPLHSDKILSYEDKYVSNAKSGGSKGMASVSRVIPAKISDVMRERIRSLAVKAFKALGCCGVSRIDFMLDESNGELYFNEINTIPGSLAFYLWEPLGVDYPELLDRMIALALKRARAEENVTYAFDTNILNMAKLGGSKGSKV